MRYRVIAEGISQRPAPGQPILPCAVGAVIEISDSMATYLLQEDPPRIEPLDGTPFDDTPGSIATVNSNEAVELVAQADTTAELDRLEKAEKASRRHPGGRKGVLNAIVERREELKA